MADHRALDELCEWMRANGATSARVGDVALTLGPIPPSVASGQPVEGLAQSPTPEDTEREDLETLLLSSGADVAPLLERMRKARAA